MFYVFAGITVLLSLLFLRHYLPIFKDADDLFSILGFFLIYVVTTSLIGVVVFIPYYWWM
ncbi:MAG: hypothetical protein L7T62_06925 [Flavobacteriaceae bacterium]|nr:hypothetical protein [Flavobacteriaceae bacterium]